MHCEIIIIGGGPAGISTALHMSQCFPELTSHIRVLEKAHYPRPKLCAGALVEDAEILLERLGLDISEIPHSDAEAAHYEFAGRGLVIRSRKHHILRIIRREEFDAWLAAKAQERGISVSEGITVQKVTPTATHVNVSTDRGDYHAHLVVGADGSNSIFRRRVFPETPARTCFAFEVRVPPETGSIHNTNDAYFDFSSIPEGNAGYIWDFPTHSKGGSMRCWGLYASTVRPRLSYQVLKTFLVSEMERHGIHLDDHAVKGYPIHGFHPFSRQSVERIILVGDAAGADSLFGEGISMALGYGYVAAHAIKDAINTQDFSFRDYRTRILMSPLGRALSVRWFIAKILYNAPYAWFQKLLWWNLNPVVTRVANAFVLNWAKRLK
ncbi:MAG: NAD(P)/FAD-dependent oxidoreductase [Desulfomonilia bacterium]